MKQNSPTSVGREAESRVAQTLLKLGYDILDQNWRTKFCEIDIVASKDNIIFLIEVKYRRDSRNSGDGFDAITATKLRQMRRASEAWVAIHNWDGDVRLVVVAADNESLRLIEIND
jgi:Holliday junction resolvase-like predicted endonuclease